MVLAFPAHLLPTTMTSADFSALPNSWLRRPPQVRALSFFLSLPDLHKWAFVLLGLRIGVHTHPPIRASYLISVRQYRNLQSRFLHSIPHGKRACDLLMLRAVTPAHKGLAPSRQFQRTHYLAIVFLPMLGTHRRLAQWRVKWLIEHSTSHQLLWCIDSFVLRNPPLRQAPKR
jgi:hypothetical protein